MKDDKGDPNSDVIEYEGAEVSSADLAIGKFITELEGHNSRWEYLQSLSDKIFNDQRRNLLILPTRYYVGINYFDLARIMSNDSQLQVIQENVSTSPRNQNRHNFDQQRGSRALDNPSTLTLFENAPIHKRIKPGFTVIIEIVMPDNSLVHQLYTQDMDLVVPIELINISNILRVFFSSKNKNLQKL